MSFVPDHLTRTLVLVWRRLGSARIYVVAILVVVLVLAALGLWHLIAPRKQIESSASDTPFLKSTPPPVKSAVARISPGVAAASATPAASPSAPAAPQLAREVAITDITQKERRGPRGETFVVATIGMSSQTTTEKEKLEIQVLFFDVTPDNQMRPTDAQVTYQWLTPVRDWTDPTPKYLAATYLKPPSPPMPRRSFFAKASPRQAAERLRYGGFLVRIYVDGKVQDERSEPESLIASLRASAPPSSRHSPDEGESPPPHTSSVPAAPSPPQARQPFHSSPSESAPVRRSPSEGGSPAPSNSPTDHQSPPTFELRPPTFDSSLPKGIPISGKPGFVQSPYDPKFIIDVRGFPPGTLVNDPNTNKPFRVP